MDRHVDGQADESTNRWMEIQMNGKTDREQTEGWISRLIERQTDVQKDA